MNYFSDLAKKYNAEVFLAMRLLIVSIPARSRAKFDIGFGRVGHQRSIIFRHYELAGGVYVYGYGAKEISVHLRNDDRLSDLIRHLLSEYAFAIEWDGKDLIARINMWYCVPSEDGTNGERFLIEFQNIASSIQSAASLVAQNPQNTRLRIGPAWLRSASNIAAFFSPGVGFIIFSIYVIHRMWPMIAK